MIIGHKGSILPCLLSTSTQTARLNLDHQMVTKGELGIRHYSPTEVTACLKGEINPLSELSTKCSLFSWPAS